MSNPKLKSENYAQLGGINTKISQYLMAPTEFLDIKNFDFQTIGSLNQRWGSTQYIGQTFAGGVNALFEFSRLNGSSYIMVGATGGIWFGATQTNLTGLSFTHQSATLVPGYLYIGQAVFSSAGGNHAYEQQAAMFTSDYSKVWGTGSTAYLNPIQLVDNTESFAVLANYLFMADANKFSKFDGATTTSVSLPYVMRVANPSYNPLQTFSSPASVTLVGFGSTATLTGASIVGWPNLGSTSQFMIYMSYVNNRGFEGPLTPVGYIAGTSGIVSFLGASYFQYGMQVATPLAYGISAINIYTMALGTTNVLPVNQAGATGSPFNFDPVFFGQTPASGSTTTWVYSGTSIGAWGSSAVAQNIINNAGTAYTDNGYLPLGLTLQTGIGAYATLVGFQNAYSEMDLTTYFPRYLELYQNRSFAAGFSTTPSFVWFSDAAEPEGYTVDANIEVRTNDGDVITCLKSYSGRLVIFKSKSFHVLTGDSPETFVIQEASNQYGCINNRCAIVFNQTLLFLDQTKGVMEFNGANVSYFSPKVEAYFQRMNLSAAINTACMLHGKARNQILIAIPVDGSSTNNLTLVYDYAANAWTTYAGFNPSAFANIQGVNTKKYPFYGDSGGRINQFSASFIADNGVGMTLSYKTHFHAEMGESIEKQFRRLYINSNVAGFTLNMAVNFYQDYGASIVKSFTIPITEFQDRIDFGIPAKALSYELYTLPSVTPLNIFGYTIEERLQRRV